VCHQPVGGFPGGRRSAGRPTRRSAGRPTTAPSLRPSVERVSKSPKEHQMNDRLQDRFFAGFGIASVVLMLAGVGIGSIGHDRNLTITSTPGHLARAFADPAGTATWIRAYI